MILFSAIIMGAVGLLFALFLGIADRKFKVELDPKVVSLEEALPGVNCGGCGYATCEAYAAAIAAGEASALNLCVVGGSDTAGKVAEIMGVEAGEEREKQIAVVFCQGGCDVAKSPGKYEGIQDCAAAIYSQDVGKSCKYGCVGLGSCVKSCPFDAIHLSEQGIPYVDAEKCTACGNCVVACPRDLIELHPMTAETFVYCKSQDPAVIAKKACGKACIACKICVKAAAKDENETSVVMKGNLAVVDTENYSAKPEYGEKCPTGAYASNINVINRDRALGREPKAEDAASPAASRKEEERTA